MLNGLGKVTQTHTHPRWHSKARLCQRLKVNHTGILGTVTCLISLVFMYVEHVRLHCLYKALLLPLTNFSRPPVFGTRLFSKLGLQRELLFCWTVSQQAHPGADGPKQKMCHTDRVAVFPVFQAKLAFLHFLKLFFYSRSDMFWVG